MHAPMKHRPLQLAVVALLAALVTVAAATPMAAQQAASSGAAAVASRQIPNATLALHMPWAGTLKLIGGLSALTPTPGEVGQAADGPNTSLSGPRVRPEILGVEPNIVEHDATAAAVASSGKNTIVISTLALVLIAVIITILVVD